MFGAIGKEALFKGLKASPLRLNIIENTGQVVESRKRLVFLPALN